MVSSTIALPPCDSRTQGSCLQEKQDSVLDVNLVYMQTSGEPCPGPGRSYHLSNIVTAFLEGNSIILLAQLLLDCGNMVKPINSLSIKLIGTLLCEEDFLLRSLVCTMP